MARMSNTMDNNVTAAARHFQAQEASHERACYCAASAHGMTGEQADQCDDGDKDCPACPFPRVTTDALLRARGLPALAYVDNYDKTPGTAPVICVKRGELGYFGVSTTQTAEELNHGIGVTPAQAEAMHVGSVMGWSVPGAYPQTWERLERRRQEVRMHALMVYNMADPESVPRAG